MTCQLAGWGGGSNNSPQNPITVYNSNFCDESIPFVNAVYCSRFTSNDHNSCSASLGSPVLCIDDEYLSGFVINKGDCSATGDHFSLLLQSIEPHREWIEEVSGAEAAAKLSIILILSTVLINLW